MKKALPWIINLTILLPFVLLGFFARFVLAGLSMGWECAFTVGCWINKRATQ